MVLSSTCEYASSALFLRARALINFLMRAASALEITNGEQRALRKFSSSWNLSLLKCCQCVPSNLVGTFKTGQQAQSYASNMHKALSRFNHHAQ